MYTLLPKTLSLGVLMEVLLLYFFTEMSAEMKMPSHDQDLCVFKVI